MSRKKVTYVDGQGIDLNDVNLIAGQAYSSVDDAVSQLINHKPYNGSDPVDVGVFPPPGYSRLVAPGPGYVVVSPCTMVIGPTVVNSIGVRTVDFAGQTISFAASTSGRNDLVYARVYLDQSAGTQTRFVKDPTSKVVSAQNLNPITQNVATIYIASGTEGATSFYPTAPTVAGSYVIPLAYLYIPPGYTPPAAFTGVVYEVAPSLYVSSAPRPVPYVSNPGAFEFLPSVMVGEVKRYIPLTCSLEGLPSGTVLDSKLDWRQRFFRATVSLSNTAGTSYAYTSGTGSGQVPSANSGIPVTCTGATFKDDFTTYGHAYALKIDSTNWSPAGAHSFWLEADWSTGYLRFYKDANFNATAFIWLEASAQYGNTPL